ncbi:Hypothetical predicted protein [Prunus dulcis]|uniref:Uncharacterized protein n=1 Tax=Prunus dulcis TaxID=3755 RepID=A0A5E4ELY5_PRUDU|nr:Hypothetical predicted protein [Prunus dulcis]
MMIASVCSSTGHLDVEKKRSIQILHGLERRLSKKLEKASFQKREASDLKTLVTNTFPNWCGYLSCKKYGYMKGRPQNWSPAEIRHSFVVYRYGARITIPKTLYEAKHLRTLLLIEDSSRLDNGDKIYSSFEYLRVLDLNHCDLVDMPNSLGDLICLRHLDLSYTLITQLPISIRLRHLNLSGSVSLTFMQYGIKRFRQLQTLPLFVTSQWNIEDAIPRILVRKENLESLALYWGFIPGFKDSFTKPPNAPAEIDIWFPSLEELSISDVANLEEWSSANDGNAFCRLKNLTVKSCPKLAHISLPQSLQHLELRDCNPTMCEELSSLPQSLQNLKALESLEISDCHSLTSLPNCGIACLVSLRILSIENCSELTSLSSSLEQLTLLEHLTIMYCPKRGSFLAGVQHLSSLRSLFVLDFLVLILYHKDWKM